MIKVFKESFDWSFLAGGFMISLFISTIVALPIESMTTGTGFFFKWFMSFMLFMITTAVLATYDNSIATYRNRIYEQNQEIEYLKKLILEKEGNLKNEN